MDEHYVYLIACCCTASTYVKIGMTSSIRRRISNVQTGCPLAIKDAFVILSEYGEEVEGLEKLLHVLLRPNRIRGEWYMGTSAFFLALEAVLTRVNAGEFSYEEIESLPDYVGPELEIMLHRHEFKFRHVHLPIRKSKFIREISEPSTPEQISALLRRRLSEIRRRLRRRR